MAGQSCTSSKLRPQPLHQSSPWLVEQIAMHGVSGVVAYQSSQAAMAVRPAAPRRWRCCGGTRVGIHLGQGLHGRGQHHAVGLGILARQWLMAASMSVMWMAAMVEES